MPSSIRTRSPANCHHALDIALGRIERIPEHDHVAARDRLQLVHELVDEDSFLVGESGHHARALNLHRLVQEDDDECRNGQRDENVAHPYPPNAACGSWRGGNVDHFRCVF